MKLSNIFMTGNWENLIMSTFEVNENILKPYLPKDSELDLYNGKVLMSMVAFTFSKVKFFGFKVPFHQKFGQINFRFYVKSKVNNTKGVVFIKEFAPKPLIAYVANVFYNEPYFFKKIGLNKANNNNVFTIKYTYKNLKIEATSKQQIQKLEQNSMNQFVVDRYIAYIKSYNKETIQYKINHKPWNLFKTESININKNVLTLLPKKFKEAKYISSCFVDGSYITVQKGISQSKNNKIILDNTVKPST